MTHPFKPTDYHSLHFKMQLVLNRLRVLKALQEYAEEELAVTNGGEDEGEPDKDNNEVDD